MVDEKYFEKLNAKHIKYWYLAQPDAAINIEKLAREIAKYTDDERKVTRILNACRRLNILSVDDLIEADLDAIAKARNIGLDAINIVRQIKGLPILTEGEVRPYAKTYRVEFYNPVRERETLWCKDFHTLREFNDYFNSDECEKGTLICHIYEIKKEG